MIADVNKTCVVETRRIIREGGLAILVVSKLMARVTHDSFPMAPLDEAHDGGKEDSAENENTIACHGLKGKMYLILLQRVLLQSQRRHLSIYYHA